MEYACKRYLLSLAFPPFLDLVFSLVDRVGRQHVLFGRGGRQGVRDVDIWVEGIDESKDGCGGRVQGKTSCERVGTVGGVEGVSAVGDVVVRVRRIFGAATRGRQGKTTMAVEEQDRRRRTRKRVGRDESPDYPDPRRVFAAWRGRERVGNDGEVFEDGDATVGKDLDGEVSGGCG